MNVCKFKILELFLNMFRLINFKFDSGRGPSLGILVRIETYLMVFFWKIDVYSPGKIQPRPFWALFSQNSPLLGPKSAFWLISPERFIEFC